MARIILAGFSVMLSIFTFIYVIRLDERLEGSQSNIRIYTETNTNQTTLITTNKSTILTNEVRTNQQLNDGYRISTDILDKDSDTSTYYNEGFTGQKIPVLCYHRIDKKAPDIFYVTKEKFKWQMEFIKKNYNVISTKRLVDYVRYHSGLKMILVSIPSNAVVIQFDDNYRSVYKEAYPILKRLKLPWTFFVYKHHHRPNRRVDLVTMARNGVDIQSHSMTHPFFHKPRRRQSFKAYLREMNWQIGGSKKYLEKISGRPVVYMAYPFGSYSDLAIKLCHKYLYQGMFAADGGYATKKSNPNFIERILVKKFWSKAFFKKVLDGKIRYKKYFKPTKLLNKDVNL